MTFTDWPHVLWPNEDYTRPLTSCGSIITRTFSSANIAVFNWKCSVRVVFASLWVSGFAFGEERSFKLKNLICLNCVNSPRAQVETDWHHCSSTIQALVDPLKQSSLSYQHLFILELDVFTLLVSPPFNSTSLTWMFCFLHASTGCVCSSWRFGDVQLPVVGCQECC